MEKDEEDLKKELGLSDDRADELVRIVSAIMDKETPGGGYGRTSHVLLNIAGRKDLNDVEKVACVFLFACRAMRRGRTEGPKGPKGAKGPKGPNVCRPPMFMPEGLNIKKKEFIDLEEGISGMVIAPEGVDFPEMTGVIMATLISMLRQMPKSEAQDFCRIASLSFAKMALTGDIRL